MFRRLHFSPIYLNLWTVFPPEQLIKIYTSRAKIPNLWYFNFIDKSLDIIVLDETVFFSRPVVVFQF